MFKTVAKEAKERDMNKWIPSTIHLQVENQTNDRKEKDQKGPTEFTRDSTIGVHDFKDNNQVKYQDDQTHNTTTVRKHIIEHSVL